MKKYIIIDYYSSLHFIAYESAFILIVHTSNLYKSKNRDLQLLRRGSLFKKMLLNKTMTNGSGGGIRTPDRVINSHLLYQLSYT